MSSCYFANYRKTGVALRFLAKHNISSLSLVVEKFRVIYQKKLGSHSSLYFTTCCSRFFFLFLSPLISLYPPSITKFIYNTSPEPKYIRNASAFNSESQFNFPSLCPEQVNEIYFAPNELKLSGWWRLIFE